MTTCKNCSQSLGRNNQNGRYCWPCTKALRCRLCGRLRAQPGSCPHCARLLEQIHEAHLGECETKRDDVEERIARYAELAGAGLPLFEECI